MFTFCVFANDHIHNVVLTLPKTMKVDVENYNVVLMLSSVVYINFEIDNADSTLFNVINCNVDKHNVFSALVWCYLRLWRLVNLKISLKQRWNVCCGISRKCTWKLVQAAISMLCEKCMCRILRNLISTTKL